MADRKLKKRLQMIAPDSRVTLTWMADGDTVHSRGIIGCDNQPIRSRRIEAPDRDLLLTPTADGISVSKITATDTEPLGTLNSIHPREQPTETLRITDAGIDVPPTLVGYTGSLILRTHADSRYITIDEPGLQQYSRRFLVELHPLYPVFVHEKPLWIRPSSGSERKYELVDDRSHSETPEPTSNQQRYGDLQRVANTVHTLSTAVFADDRLDERASDRIGRKLHALQSQLLDARTVLVEPSPREMPLTTDKAARYSWEKYTDALEWIDTQIDTLQQRIETDDELPLERKLAAKTRLSQLTELDAIRQTLAESHDVPASMTDEQPSKDNRPQLTVYRGP
ncbi:hypothetical protein [Natronorubrum texcoconense]|uniref:Uncharacterized protein n=1 Tax=Natronorubrum texcoconense TaxID=1095776 RepID=A0A1G8V015_9EURY|nr:hypothetical protein [Natronorubrum texcoconense]SDJ59194.1 hypothetical protein SAMN04515672_1102 [Natronorubrum texcoconense]